MIQTRSTILALTLLFCFTFTFPVAAQDWLRWSGSKGDFTSKETKWSDDWPADGLKKQWQVNVGTGFSSVTIADGLLYTMGRNDGKDVTYCLNADSGEEVWRHEYDAKLFDNLHEGGPGATPTIDQQHLYTLARGGQLFCLDRKSGEVQWETNVCDLVDIKAPEWGLTSTPLIEGEKLLVEAGRILALDKKTGKEIWQSESKQRPGYGSPVVFQHGGQRLVASLNNDNLKIVKLQDGVRVTSYKWETRFATSAATPMIVDDNVYISTGYQKGSLLAKFDGEQLSKVYETKKMANHMNSCVLIDGHLYGIHGNSHNARTCTVVCMEFLTGEVKWSHRGLGCGSLIAAGKRLLILSDSGTLVCANANPAKFEQLAESKVLKGRCWTVPVLLNHRVYCRNAKGDIVCVKLPD